jgi:CRISPR-associated endonuclease/helicase Cas3
MKFKRLLAKSPPDPWHGAASFVGHSAAVMRSAEVLLEKLDRTIIRQLELECDRDRFAATVRLGTYLHDWGKANQHFQVMVRLKRSQNYRNDRERKQQTKLKKFWQSINQRQMLRHETLSGILALKCSDLRTWLESCPDADLMVAVLAAMGHHLKLGGKRGQALDEIAKIPDGTGSELEIYANHDNFTALLNLGINRLNLPAQLPQLPDTVWTREQLKAAMDDLLEEFVEFKETLDLDSERSRFLAAVKATVMAADIAGSALPQVKDNDIEPWIRQVLDLVLTEDDLQSLIEQRLGNNPLRSFQAKMAATRSRVTLVRAGCGTGKTVGAYAWSKKYARDRRLFFCYPTTGTASQGYLDYAAETNIESLLMHSRAQIDLENVLFSYEGQQEQTTENDEDAERIDARLASFKTWQAKLIVCTVDSVLGLIQNNRKPMYAWSAICQSAFVFDEVHAFDDRLFGALLRFLQTFRGAPILLMSASFTPEQLTVLRQTIAALGEAIEEIEEGQLEKLKRYTLHLIADPTEAWESVRSALERQEKVLWVTNTVSDCVEIYRQASQYLSIEGIELLIYHSRFRYQDRVQKHQSVIEAFKSDRPTLAITTQVCEMSLDLNADLLVSAMAPATALIQRLGRLNRRKTQEDGMTRPAIIYPWDRSKPYSSDELDTGQRLLELLPAGAISQKDLADAASQLSLKAPSPILSNWLDGHWRSYPGFLREAGYTLTVLLEQDLAKITENTRNSGQSFGVEAQRWSVPILLTKKLRSLYPQWQRKGVYPVAPSDIVTYSLETGAQLCL